MNNIHLSKKNLLCMLFIVGFSCVVFYVGIIQHTEENPIVPQKVAVSIPERTDDIQDSLEDMGISCLNDVDRLDTILDRFNNSTKQSYSGVFGVDDRHTEGMIGIEYEIFNSLSDDGVAAVVAQALASRETIETVGPAELANNNNPIIRRDVLAQDEKAGQFMAKAGYQVDGFEEFVTSVSLQSPIVGEVAVSQAERIQAFRQGYILASNK